MYNLTNCRRAHTKLTATLRNLLSEASSALAIYPQPTVTRYKRVITPLYTPSTSSLEALRRDWERVGMDISQVISRQGSVPR
jgi:hypothetical protein